MSKILFTAALVVFSTITFAQSDSATIFLQKGLEEKGKGRLMESYKNFDKAYYYNKGDKQIISLLATSLMDLRRYVQAKEMYQKLEQMGDLSAENYKRLMHLSFNLRQFPDAIKYANVLKKIDPSEKVDFFIGKAHYDEENYGDAIKHLNAAAKDDPTNGEIPYMIARAYADMMNYKNAIPFFQKAIELQPTQARWIYEMALIYYAIPDDKNSLKYLLEAAEKGYKRDNEYLENLGIAYLNVGDLTNGLAIMHEILKRRPTDMNILNMVAEAYYDAKKYDEAINYWDQVLAIDKTNAASLYMIGLSYQKKGDKQKGMALCDKAIEMDPSLARNKQKVQMPGM